MHPYRRRRVVADHAPLDAEERERRLRARRGMTVGAAIDGMTRMVIDADPESAGFLLAALGARTALRRDVHRRDVHRREVRFRPSETPGRTSAAAADAAADDPGVGVGTGAKPPIDDRRTLAQRRLDALVDVCRESLGRDDGELAGVSVSMLVTVPLEVLVSGVGAGRIAGVDEPVCARTVRRLAAEAEIIPIVLGGDGEVLDAGRSRRFFSRAQHRAMAARDGGCVFPGCRTAESDGGGVLDPVGGRPGRTARPHRHRQRRAAVMAAPSCVRRGGLSARVARSGALVHPAIPAAGPGAGTRAADGLNARGLNADGLNTHRPAARRCLRLGPGR
ncbi:MAG: DUF222 domain-containing protein [Microbacteriaceae bacterium]